ncbi:hypothetical protein EVG20_g3830 [Dentipellis fragilis]|uniref:BRO1 domain-containing protein n=1 Tax=Dentipellis fragilis TaxID=205917 RepID=A0A4Y9YZF5_9AGAM|nr:hypothetical protein EVG20_g3830 [Dentipellis fragilis]
MPNQLSIPFKKSYALPLKHAVQNHIQARHPETSPHAFQWDISRWEALRKEAISGVVHVNSIEALTRHLVFILTKLPVDIALEISYATVFAPTSLPVTLSNLQFERCATLFNLAALYSQLASAEDRSKTAGVKRASTYYQARALSYLASSALPKLKSTIAADDIPIDLTDAFIESLQNLMLAQAQECVWQRAIMETTYSNGIVARLSAQASTLYATALSKIQDASPSIKHVFPSDWTRHIEAKQLHFLAAAQYRKGIDDLEADRYGHEIGRLIVAQSAAKKGYDIARRGNVAPAVLQDVKSLLGIVEKNLARAERDNDLIYHKDVPSASALPTIQPASMVQSITPPEILDPKKAIGDNQVIFHSLLSYGARLAIEIYHDRRQGYLKDEIVNRAQHLSDKANDTIRALNLPASLDALEKPIGLPPSLLKKAEEVRLENGPLRIEKLIEDIQMLAQRDSQILSDAMDILDDEAEEDENFRVERHTERLPSHEANLELTTKAQGYQGAIAHAGDSDAVVRLRWHEWEANITQLTWDEARLEACVPSSTLPANGTDKSNSETHMHARKLRLALEKLDDLSRARADLVRRAELLVDADDIEPQVVHAAASIERWTEVHSSMFDEILDEELVKFEKFHNDIEEGAVQQEDLLNVIRTENDAFLLSRKDDPSVKEREHALQSMDLAYHKYKEIIRHLDEGFQFYNNLAGILMTFKDSCKEWTRSRRDEMHSMSRSMKSLSVQPEVAAVPPSPPSQDTPLASATPKPSRMAALNIPPPDSAEWQTLDLPPPPPKAQPKKTSRKAKAQPA